MSEELKATKDEIQRIKIEKDEHIYKVQILVQPVAGIAAHLLSRRGVDKGFIFNKRVEFKNDDFYITQKRNLSWGRGDVNIYYKGDLVMSFDDWFPNTRNFKDATRQLLYKFIQGEWVKELTSLYHKETLGQLKECFNIGDDE